MRAPSTATIARLENERNLWLATIRGSSRPHLVPLWFVWHQGKFHICIEPDSVKARNMRHNPRVALSLQDGDAPVICEGTAVVYPPPWPKAVIEGFKGKYEWDITAETQYTQVVAIMPEKWLIWNGE